MRPTSGSFRIIEDPRFQDHRGPGGHPERPDRLVAVSGALAAFEERVERGAPRAAERDEIEWIHGAEHFATVAEAARQGPGRLDPDTYVSPASHDVARLAAGAAVDLLAAVATGEVASGFAAVRPPGHHAEAERAMGFCLYNNVAIAARAVQRRHGVGKILILDWDVHHGNGTQHSFEEDPSILYASTHQFPYYPGTGAASEAGRGAGQGTTLNIPMPAGCGDAEYVGALRRLLVPAARAFAPEMIVVSAGYDAHRDDPIASMELSADGYRDMTRIVRALAEELCEGRIAFVLEGGYAASGLFEGTTATLEAMLADEVGPLPESAELDAGSTLRGIVERVVAVHGGHVPDLGAA